MNWLITRTVSPQNSYLCTETTHHCASVRSLPHSKFQTENNRQRLYFLCSEYEQGCIFFQWGDEVLSDEKFQLVVAQAEKKWMQRVAKEQFLHKLGDQTQLQTLAPTLTSVVMTDEDTVNFLDDVKQEASWKKHGFEKLSINFNTQHLLSM